MLLIKRLLLLLFISAALAAGYLAYYANRPLTLPSLPLEFSIQPGSSLKSAAHQMRQAGVLSNDLAFVFLVRVLGKTAQIKAGEYELKATLTTFQLLDMISKGRVSQRELSVIEGWSFNQLRAALNANPNIRHDSVALSEAEIMQHIGAKEAFAEGLFFPDTYYFSKGSSDLDLLSRAYQTMQTRLSESWENREQDLPLESSYQALTLASIVEKETGHSKDRDMIAGVFINRLHKGMLLQTDPTVIYGMGEQFDGNLRKRDLLTDTLYNTYTRAGLPPTPIALPGLAALQATLHPAQTDALFFVARGDGTSEFSVTLRQHNNAVNRYQK